jgi:hypothetical protein
VPRPPDFEKYKQDPSDVLDYLNDWQDTSEGKPFLGPSEVIDTSTWTAYTTGWVETDDITIDDPVATKTDTTATVWVSGGVLGTTYYLTNHIVTDEGREKDDTISITIEEQ